VGRKKHHTWLGYNIILHDDNLSEVAVGAEGGGEVFTRDVNAVIAKRKRELTSD